MEQTMNRHCHAFALLTLAHTRTSPNVNLCSYSRLSHQYFSCPQWYEAHYGVPLGRKKGQTIAEDDPLNKKKSNHLKRKLDSRKEESKIDAHLESQYQVRVLPRRIGFSLWF